MKALVLLTSTILILGELSLSLANPTAQDTTLHVSELRSSCRPIKGVVPNDNCEYLWDDMLMTESQLLVALGMIGMNGQTNPDKFWTNGIIPIKFNRSEIEENGVDEQLLWDVADDFNGEMNGCLSMVPWTDEANYVMVIRSTGCWSPIGMSGGEQYLSLGSGCWWPSVIVHEFIHAFGFHHEQVRPDRDQYVEILWDNIIEDKKFNYELFVGSHTYGVAYDGLSVMHYGSTYFTNGNGLTMNSLKPGLWTTAELGSGTWMSEGDKEKLRMMYECDGINCGGVLTEAAGKITSPEYPMAYPYYQNCTWNIACTGSVEITINSFEVGPTAADCCQTLDLTMFNDAASSQGGRAGTYEQTTPMNGRPAWISTNGWYGIWWVPYYSGWIIGSASSIGGGSGGVFPGSSGGDYDCPQSIVTWKYWDGSGFVEAAAGDVVLECQAEVRTQTANPCLYYGGTYEGLTISDDSTSETFCGTAIPNTLSKTGPLEINFAVGTNDGYTGFELDYVCDGAGNCEDEWPQKKCKKCNEKKCKKVKKCKTKCKNTCNLCPDGGTSSSSEECEDKWPQKKCKKKCNEKKCKKDKKCKKNCKNTCDLCDDRILAPFY